MSDDYSKIPITRDISDEEKDVSADIFASYCAFRKGKGLSVPAWDPDLAGLAYVTAVRDAALGKLVHRTALTDADAQGRCSDILQYSTWRMTGGEAVQRWASSAGHRKMMQCDSTQRAGVGAYKNPEGVWYYAIVYDFCGRNQSGS